MNEVVSVIIPIYNRSKVINRAINSVISQTYKNLELILVDDCSDDIEELEKIVKSYASYNIIFHKNPTNLNGAVSRNIGIELAKGEYVAFLDSDDEWLPTKIEEQLKLARQQKDSNFLIYTKSKRFGKQFTEISPIRAKYSHESIADYLFLNDGYIQTSSFFIHSVIVKKIGFNPKLKRHQDYDLLLKLEEYGLDFVLLDEVLVNVYSDPNSKSEQRGASYERSLYFLNDYKKYFTKEAYNSFWLKNVAFYMSRDNKKSHAIKELFLKKRYKGLKLKTFFIYSIYILFVDTFLYNLLEKIYIRINRKK